jgi:hypothetical protein
MKFAKYFRRPVIPKAFLSVQPNEGWKTQYFLIVMEDISWGHTKEVESGISIEELLSVIDDLAEFHAF